MTHKILKSLLPTEEHVNAFQRLANAQIDEMRAHEAHMKLVAKDPKNFHPYPAPSAHPDVMAAITREGEDFNVEFEIIDDIPAPTLADKKNQLSHNLLLAFNAAREKILPARKANLLNIQMSAIAKIKVDDRSAEQNKKIKEFETLNFSLGLLDLHHAKMESEIHDLTDDNIDTWHFEPFPETK